MPSESNSKQEDLHLLTPSTGSSMHQSWISTLMKMYAALLTSMSNAASQMMKLSEVVSKVQKHQHSATCRGHGKCCFHYPRPPSPETVIARQSTAATYPEEFTEQAVKALAAVCRVLDDKDTPAVISMNCYWKQGCHMTCICADSIFTPPAAVLLCKESHQNPGSTPTIHMSSGCGEPTWTCSTS